MKNVNIKPSFGIFGYIALILIAAKAFGFGTYSWLTAIFPLFIPIILITVFFIITFVVMLISKRK